MMNAYEYSVQLKHRLSSKKEGWSLTRISNPDDEYEDRKFEKTLAFLGKMHDEVRDEVEMYSHHLSDTDAFSPHLDLLAPSLIEDIGHYTNNQYDARLKQTVLTFLPTGWVDGFCLNQDEFGNQLDGYVIGINEGLYFSLQFIAKAYVLESVQGDFAQYRRNGGALYHDAIRLFSDPSANTLSNIFFEDVPAEVDGALSGAQSSIAMIILQFIVLHEFGHIVNDDLELMGLYKIHVAPTRQNNEGYEPNNTYWESEYKADEFALLSICQKAKNDISAWANFMGIYMLFRWFSDIEKHLGKTLSEFHPPPLKRADKLKALMKSTIPGWENVQDEVERIDNMTHVWYASAEPDK